MVSAHPAFATVAASTPTARQFSRDVLKAWDWVGRFQVATELGPPLVRSRAVADVPKTIVFGTGYPLRMKPRAAGAPPRS